MRISGDQRYIPYKKSFIWEFEEKAISAFVYLMMTPPLFCTFCINVAANKLCMINDVENYNLDHDAGRFCCKTG